MLALIPLIPGLLAANNWYVNWHDDHNDSRYVRKNDFQLAQSVQLDNASKLDSLAVQISSLQVQSAVSVVGTFQQDYDRHIRNKEATILWEVEADRLKRQLDRAIAYRDCLMAERKTCEQLRGW